MNKQARVLAYVIGLCFLMILVLFIVAFFHLAYVRLLLGLCVLLLAVVFLSLGIIQIHQAKSRGEHFPWWKSYIVSALGFGCVASMLIILQFAYGQVSLVLRTIGPPFLVLVCIANLIFFIILKRQQSTTDK